MLDLKDNFQWMACMYVPMFRKRLFPNKLTRNEYTAYVINEDIDCFTCTYIHACTYICVFINAFCIGYDIRMCLDSCMYVFMYVCRGFFKLANPMYMGIHQRLISFLHPVYICTYINIGMYIETRNFNFLIVYKMRWGIRRVKQA
jgi:hypothetical protein